MAEQEMPVFDLDSFIEGVQRDKSKEKGANDRLKKMLMNVKDNQGTTTFIPIISKSLKNIYAKIERVREYNGKTSLIDSGEAWYKILPIERYGELAPHQIELYNEVVGLYDEVFGWELDFDEARIRNYSLFTGITLKHINTEGKEDKSWEDMPCLLVYPSLSPINALDIALTNKKSVMKDKTAQWLTKIISPTNKGHQGVAQISFIKSDTPGYNSTVTFEVNNEYVTYVDPAKEYSTELLSKFDDPIQIFLGWCYDYDNKSYFNEVVFKELRDNLKLRLKELNEGEVQTPSESYENRNGSQDPMISQTPSNRPF